MPESEGWDFALQVQKTDTLFYIQSGHDGTISAAKLKHHIHSTILECLLAGR